MNYKYVAYSARNGIVKGQIDARYEADVRDEIMRGGMKVLRLSPARQRPGLEKIFPSLFKVKSSEIVRFARQLATMLASGGNLLRALEMLTKETPNRVMRTTLAQIRRRLDEGGSLSDALSEHPKLFSPLFVSVVEVGEYTGKLAPALEQLADILEKEQEAKSQAIRTLMYPAAIIGLSMVTLGILMTVALPPLLEVFDKMDAEIPLMTRIVVGAVRGLRENFQIMAVGVGGFVALLAGLRKYPRTKYAIDSIMLRMPTIGPFLVAGELSRFARTISMLLEAGVTLANAIHLAKSGCKNQEFKRAFSEAEESLLSGHGILDALRKYPVIPTMFIELLLLGEESNSLQRTMKDAADAYQKQLEQRLEALLAMLEPVSTVVVGGVVGIIAFSMFVPIYSGLNVGQ